MLQLNKKSKGNIIQVKKPKKVYQIGPEHSNRN